jgi:hypothetical protein
MSKVKPAPEQLGVGHIQKPLNPSGSPTTRWNHIPPLMKVRPQCRQ